MMHIWFVIIAAILWGTTGTAQSFAPEEASPLIIGAIRLLIGGVVLLCVVILQGKLTLKRWPLAFTVIAAVSIALYQPLFFTAVSLTGIAVGTVVGLGSAPILAGILEAITHRKAPEKKWWIATGLAIIGCLLLFAQSGEMIVDPTGIALAVGAGLSFASYTIANKQLLAVHRSETVVAVVFTLGALLLSPLFFMFNLSWISEASGLAVTLHLGLITAVLAYFLFAKGLLGVPASTAVTLVLAEPLTAALLGVFLVGEFLPPLSWLGIFSILAAIVILSSKGSGRSITA